MAELPNPETFRAAHETVFNHALDPDCVMERSGFWADPWCWRGGRVPAAREAAAVAPGVFCRYAWAGESPPLRAVLVWGHLAFEPGGYAWMDVQTLTVAPGGVLSLCPGPRGAHGVCFLDLPHDPRDQAQWGNGLLVLGGHLLVRGEPRRRWARLALEAGPGSDELALAEDPEGWRRGDGLLLPGAGPGGADYWSYGRYESAQARGVAGRTVRLERGLADYHGVGRDLDGAATPGLSCPVANTACNVTFGSENPAGVRGHAAFLGGATADVEHAAFLDLGRTKGGDVGDDNRLGRYAVHFHHANGRVDGRHSGRLVGCLITRAGKWAVVVHQSHHLLIEGNAAVDFGQAGFVTEEGGESRNLFRGNLAACSREKVQFFDTNHFRQGGAGFWMESSNSALEGNLAVGCPVGYWYSGLVNSPAPNRDFAVPVEPGSAQTEGYSTHGTANVTGFRGNAAVSCGQGLFADHRPGYHAFEDFRAWHMIAPAGDGVGLGVYDVGPFGGTLVDGCTLRGAMLQLFSLGSGTVSMPGWDDGPLGPGLLVRNADVQSGDPLGVGVRDTNSNGLVVIEDSSFRCATNVEYTLAASYGGGPLPPPGRYAKRTVLRRVRTAAPPGMPLVSVRASPRALADSASLVPCLPHQCLVYAHQGNPADNFEVFLAEQAPHALVPYEGDLNAGGWAVYAAPEPGLSNAECWAKHGIAVGGRVAPPDALARHDLPGALAAPVPAEGGTPPPPPPPPSPDPEGPSCA